jgi:hypothetical protein
LNNFIEERALNEKKKLFSGDYSFARTAQKRAEVTTFSA